MKHFNRHWMIRLLLIVALFYFFSSSMLSEFFKKGCKVDLNICKKVPTACSTHWNEPSDSEKTTCVWKPCAAGSPGWCSDGEPTYNQYAATCVTSSSPCKTSSRCRVCATYWESEGPPSNFPDGYACSTNVTGYSPNNGAVGSAGLRALTSPIEGPQLIEHTQPNNIGEVIRLKFDRTVVATQGDFDGPLKSYISWPLTFGDDETFSDTIYLVPGEVWPYGGPHSLTMKVTDRGDASAQHTINLTFPADPATPPPPPPADPVPPWVLCFLGIKCW